MSKDKEQNQPDVRQTIVDFIDTTDDLRTALEQKVASVTSERDELQTKVEALMVERDTMQKAAADQDEDHGPVLNKERLVQVLDQLAEAGMLGKTAAKKAESDPEVLLDLLEKVAHQAHSRVPSLGSPERGDGFGERHSKRSGGSNRESDQVYAAGVQRLRARMGD